MAESKLRATYARLRDARMTSMRNTKNSVDGLETGHKADCIFLVGYEGVAPAQFYCHKLVMAKSSPVFQAMFYGNMAEREQESGKVKVQIQDVHPDVFKLLIQFIYTNLIDRNSTCWVDMCELWYAAKKYMLPHLEDICIHYLTTIVKPSSVCYIYEYAELFGEPTLLQKCISIMELPTSAREIYSSRSGFVLQDSLN